MKCDVCYLDMAQRLIAFLIKSKMFHADCVENNEHGCLVIWSASAQDQIAMFIKDNLEGDNQ